MATTTDTTAANGKSTTARKPSATTTVHFNLDRETKGTFRYAEDADEPVIGTLYVRKAACAKLGNPQRIKVVLSAS